MIEDTTEVKIFAIVTARRYIISEQVLKIQTDIK